MSTRISNSLPRKREMATFPAFTLTFRGDIIAHWAKGFTRNSPTPTSAYNPDYIPIPQQAYLPFHLGTNACGLCNHHSIQDRVEFLKVTFRKKAYSQKYICQALKPSVRTSN